MPTLLRSPQRFAAGHIRIMDIIRVRKYFSDYGEEELFQVRRYWQSYSSRKELWDFGSRRTKVKYFFDNETKQYYRQVFGGRKQPVSTHSIKLDITRFSKNICKLQREWAEAMINDRIDLQEWYDGTIRLMKYSYRAGIDIARGSSSEMSTVDEREFLRLMDEEIGKFNVYAKQIGNGDVPLDGRILNGVCSLGSRINRLFENWRLWDAKRSGFTEARRRLNEAEHCQDSESRDGCVKLARMGWRPIELITPIGEATCWDGCRCEMEFR